nr:integrase, catalytic region, zinc finger, CCHC-type, peptidase aspartic, catalytic [Tanacetum cinerariifolium]
MCDSFDENNLFLFDVESVKISPVSKTPFRKKSRDSMNVPSKHEASNAIISFIKKTQVNLQLQVQHVRTDNGMEFKNKTLVKFFDEVGITQQFSATRTPQQNGVVERRNRTLVEAATTMHTFAKLPLLELDLSNLNETGKSSNPSVLQVSEVSKKDLDDLFQFFYDDYFDSSKIMKSSTTNVETSINEEVFHEVSESFQEESSSSSLKDDVKQYPDHVYALNKALYGLKEAPRGWYDVLSQFLIDSGFQKANTFTQPYVPNVILEKIIIDLEDEATFILKELYWRILMELQANNDDDAQDDDDQEDEGDDDEDDQEEGSDDEQASDKEDEEFIHPRLSTHNEEETRNEESFNPIHKTPENTDDKGNGEENIGTNVGREEGHDEADEEDELYRDININLGRGTLEANFSEFMQTNQFGGAVSSIPGIVLRYMDQRMNEAVKVAVQIQSDRLRDEAQAENDEFLKTINENMQKIINEQVKEHVKTSYAIAADLSEMELKKILIKKMEGNKSIHRSNKQRNLYKALVEAYESDKIILDTYRDTVTLKRRCDDDANKDEEPSAGSDRGSKRRREGKEPESASAPKEKKPPTPDRDWNKTLSATHESIQPWISELAKQSDSRSSFNELMDTLVDFSAFLMNRLKVDTLTPELLAGPTYELIKGSCKSLVELKFFLEEVYKATADQVDWVNPEEVPQVASIYGHIKWIEDLVPRTMWIQESVGYDKHALWGISHWGRKRQQLYCFAVNRESARDVYSKRRIIAITELKIVEWHNYKHLDWITVCRDDDKLYKLRKTTSKGSAFKT